ncbi:MAG: ADP-forming succinate--CoA ligase subunit beta [SAR202 cluster bacterium]|mgnify:CR=1 FL=1|nr:ADP-forming succinate--CoA ligase subunit beta [Chloroflexota bacterium]MQG50930.1 ADP-forming succinate--CoA ligase subunit beta [SAR202 cluster bacterium]|tara:strand:- start:7865 stop:9013 length:1149 start_codon:yes stop_codon:yes gene_type:complete
MNIHEFQAKKLFADYSIPVPEGSVATTPQEAIEISGIYNNKVVVKAQIHAGGRGKAGGVKLFSDSKEIESFSANLLGSNLITAQTGKSGVPVNKLLVEKIYDIHREIYLAIIIDAVTKSIICVASEFGGVNIEEVAESNPDKIFTVVADPILGLQPYKLRLLAKKLNITSDLIRSFSGLATSAYNLFVENDCSMVEINPLVITNDRLLLALDAKVNIDDDALFRHPELVHLRDINQEDERETRADKSNINYVKLDGNVGCLVNGAGLAMATMDVISESGSQPANFLDIGGGSDEDKVAEAMKIICSDTDVDKIFVNLFGGILRCDVAARGIVQASKETTIPPIIVRMLGTNADEGAQILLDSSLEVKLIHDLHDARKEFLKS